MIGTALMLLETHEGLRPRRASAASTASSAVTTDDLDRARDPRRFGDLVTRYQSKVHRLVAGILGPGYAADAEDATQEVFLQAYRKLESFRGDSRFSTWLYRLAYNRAIDYRRRLDKRRLLPLDEENLDRVARSDSGAFPAGGLRNASQPLKDAMAAERLSALLPQIDRLPVKQRVSLYLHYWLGCTVAEIAELTDAKPATVKSHLFRGRQALGRKLDKESR